MVSSLIRPAGIKDIDNFILNELHPSRIRNFSIIAHIDHGKTTLSGSFLHMTQTISQSTGVMVLDSLDTEKQRGITIKAHIVSMFLKYKEKVFACVCDRRAVSSCNGVRSYVY